MNKFFLLFYIIVTACNQVDIPQGTLRELATPLKIRMGTAIRTLPYGTDKDYESVVQKQYDLIVPETEATMKQLQKQEGVFSYSTMDQVVTKSLSDGQSIHGHVLIYQNSTPDWVATTSTPMQTIMKNHIENVMNHFRGKITEYYVANETISKDGKLDPKSIWWQKMGDGYIQKACEIARAADPLAKLGINEATGAAFPGVVSDKYLEISKDLWSKKLIDFVGFQMHIATSQVSDTATLLNLIKPNLQRFIDAGMTIRFSEVDVRVPVPPTDPDLVKQVNIYKELLKLCKSFGAKCDAFITWGFTDKYSWVPDFFPGTGLALPFDDTYQPKPAYWALSEALREK